MPERSTTTETHSFEEAVTELRATPGFEALLYDAYLDGNLAESAERFRQSGEFAEVLRIVSEFKLEKPVVVDLGAGTGIAAYGFARSVASRVIAVEPDDSPEVGRAAAASVVSGLPVEVLDAFGESLPLPDGCADVVYARQVLHHAADLRSLLRECARVLKPGGLLLATREHVVSDAAELAAFLSAHPIHQIAGCENAYTVRTYVQSIERAGLRIARVLGPLDSIINAYPGYQSQAELDAQPELAFVRRLGSLGHLLARLPAARRMWWKPRKEEAEKVPGRLYSFIALRDQRVSR